MNGICPGSSNGICVMRSTGGADCGTTATCMIETFMIYWQMPGSSNGRAAVLQTADVGSIPSSGTVTEAGRY